MDFGLQYLQCGFFIYFKETEFFLSYTIFYQTWLLPSQLTEDPNFSYLILGLLKSRLWWSLLRRNWSQPSAWAAWAAQTLEVKLFVETQQLKPQMGDRFTSYFSSDTSRSPAQLTQSKQEIEKILNRVTRDDIQDTFHQVRLFNIKFSSFKMSSSISPTHGRGCLGNLLYRVITLQFLPRTSHKINMMRTIVCGDSEDVPTPGWPQSLASVPPVLLVSKCTKEHLKCLK